MSDESKIVERGAPRAQARALLQRAKHVFVAYTSSDLANVRQLRNRIIRLRRPASGATVFMASDSLPVAEAVDPSHIQAELQRADLFVLACGPLTPQSPWVMGEVRQALLQRAEGRTQILPVILKAGVTLPPGIDFTIQAIHFNTLFPAIRRLRIAAGTALIVATAAAGLFASMVVRRSRERDLISLRAKLQTADLGSATSIDLAKRDWLLSQRAEALRLAATDDVRAIDAQVSRYASPELRRSWLPADRDRISLVADPGGGVVWVGYPHRIEKRGLDGRLLGQIDLKSFAVLPYEPPPVLAAGQPSPSEEPKPRSPARLLELRADPRVRGILAEVEYPDNFADRSEKESLSRAGYDSDGSEREVLAIAQDSTAIRSVGLSVELTAENDATGDIGRYDHQIDQRDVIESKLSDATDNQRSRIAREWKKGDAIHRIAVDPRTGVVAFQVIEDQGARDEHTGTFSFRGWQKQSVVRLSPDGHVADVSGVTDFFPEGARMAWPDGELDGRNPFTAVAPNYQPAAVSPASATLGYELPWKTSTEGMPRPKAVWFADNAATLRVHLDDGSVAVTDADGKHLIRRFPRSTSARATDVSSDGNTAFVVNADGGVDAWDLRSFREDGWIAAKAPAMSR